MQPVPAVPEKPKRIPVSDLNVKLFSEYTAAVFAHLRRLIEMQSKENGHWCVLTDLYVTQLSDEITLGSISALGAHDFEEAMAAHTTSPEFLQKPSGSITDVLWVKALFALTHPDLSFIFAPYSSLVYEFLHTIENEWETLVASIRSGKPDDSIPFTAEEKEKIMQHLKADPERADFLQSEFEKGFETPIIPRIWPNVAMICCVNGSFFAEYSRRMKRYSGDIPTHALAYAASESIISVPVDYDTPEYEFYINSVFLEFLEVGKEDFSQTILTDELEEGKDYEVIISSLSGFYRYRMMDVVHIEGHNGKMPFGHVAYRMNQVVNMVGEKTNTEQLEYLRDHLAEHIGTNIIAHSIFADYSVTPSRYIMFFEPDKDLGKGHQPQYDKFVDDLLRKVNVSYEKYRHQDSIGQISVMFVEPETYRLYKDVQIASGISANQVKPVLIINDKSKINFFFGLAENPYKVLKRNIFETERKLKEMEEFKKENIKLKAEIRALREEAGK